MPNAGLFIDRSFCRSSKKDRVEWLVSIREWGDIEINSDLHIDGAFETWTICYKIRGYGLVAIIPRSNSNQKLNITYARVFCEGDVWKKVDVQSIRYTSPHIQTQFFIMFNYGEENCYTDGKAYICDMHGIIT